MERQFGPFEVAVGQSLGGMSLFNATKKGMANNCLTVIGSGDIIQDILDDFAAKLELKPNVSKRLRLHFEKKHNVEMENYSAHKSATDITIPVLVIHDKNDNEVPVKAGINIHKHIKIGTLLLTEGLGLRKILENAEVIEKVVGFIQQKNNL